MQLTNKSLRPLPAGHPSTVTVTYVIISLRINLSLSGRDFTLGATLGTLQLTNVTEGGDPLQQNPPFVPHPLCFFSSQQNESIFITEKTNNHPLQSMDDGWISSFCSEKFPNTT